MYIFIVKMFHQEASVETIKLEESTSNTIKFFFQMKDIRIRNVLSAFTDGNPAVTVS